MQFPRLSNVSRYREMTTVFGGYNHQISCSEGQFYDMKNMTSKYFPILSPRGNRGIVKSFTNPQGILDKEDLWWIEDKILYRNGEPQTLEGITLTDGKKVLAKMGAYIIIMPDKVWCKANDEDSNLECGYMEHKTETKGVTISICEASGKAIEWHDADYYEKNKPTDGNYMMSVNSNGTCSLKIYSATTSIWMTVASTYVQITADGIGKGFEKEDGVKITIDDAYRDKEVDRPGGVTPLSTLDSGDAPNIDNKPNTGGSYGDNLPDVKVVDATVLDNIFINEEDDKIHRSTNTYIVDKTDNSITIPGILKSAVTEFKELTLTVERKVPDMAFITECNNRLWGCSTDGHEIYCCKLGDVKNWNLFRGTSIDSWAATIGSDGKFTGAITYLGYPMFFKEDSLIKIAVSATGGHQVKETICRGVQQGSNRSLTVLNEILYYKSTNGVCGYNGSLPYSISAELGEVGYYDAVAGAIGDKYYISMHDNKNEYSMFVYDTKTGIWCKEDGTNVLAFCRHKDELYYMDSKDNTMKSIGGTLLYDVPEKAKEDDFDWFVESGAIGYSSPDNKYVGRINLRISLEVGTNVGFYLQYDSCGEWEHKFSMSGSGTRTYAIPIIPRRCDHFKYKISGRGHCKIYSITKTVEEGSDGR